NKVPIRSARDAVWVLLDRVEIGKTPVERLTESVDAGFRRGSGRVDFLTDAYAYLFDQRFSCLRWERVFTPPEPRLFDLNDPLGGCEACRGTGMIAESVCPGCQGLRWSKDALAVQVEGRTIADWHAQPLKDLLAWTSA